MQGKERNQEELIDEPFIDRSWEAMSHMLDREMPIDTPKRKRKRYGLLFLLLLIGFTAGIGAGYYYYGQSQPEQTAPKEEKAKEEILYAKENTESPNLSSETHSELDHHHQLTDKHVDNSENIKPKLSSPQLEATQNLSVIDQSDAKVDDVNENIIAIASNTTNNNGNTADRNESNPKADLILDQVNTELLSDDPVLISSNEIKQTAEDRINAGSTEITKDNFDASTIFQNLDVLKLPLAAAPLLTSDDRVWPDEFDLKSSRKRWRFGVMAGGHLENAHLGGWSAGALASYQINPKWSFDTGLALTSLRKDELFVLNDVNLERAYNESLDDGESAVADLPTNFNGNIDLLESLELQNTSMLSLARLNYVNVPLLVSYQPVSALKLMAGLNLAVRLNKFNAFGEGGNNLDSELLSSQGRTSESVDLIFDQGIKRTDISGVIGIGYFPLKKAK